MDPEKTSITALRELKALLDTGAITQEEYDTLKKKIIFGPDPATPKGAPPTVITQPDSPIVSDTAPAPGPIILPDGFEREEPEVLAEAPRSQLLNILSLVVILFLVGLCGYFLLNRDSGQEELLSGPPVVSNTEAIDQSETGEANEAKTLPISEARDSLTEAIDSVAEKRGQNPVLLENQPDKILPKIKATLSDYYTDMEQPPFEAKHYFAPVIERFYTFQNVSPIAINDYVISSHFPEFLNSKVTFEDNSFKLVKADAEGYEVTYKEQATALRKSRNQIQTTTALVRAKFNPEFKITYFRQERLLKNEFSDPAAQ